MKDLNNLMIQSKVATEKAIANQIVPILCNHMQRDNGNITQLSLQLMSNILKGN